MRTFFLCNLWLLVFSLQAQEQGFFNPHLNKAFKYLDQAIAEASRIDNEELRDNVVRFLIKEGEGIIKNDSGRVDRTLFLAGNIDEITCDCSDFNLRGRISHLVSAALEEIKKADDMKSR